MLLISFFHSTFSIRGLSFFLLLCIAACSFFGISKNSDACTYNELSPIMNQKDSLLVEQITDYIKINHSENLIVEAAYSKKLDYLVLNPVDTLGLHIKDGYSYFAINSNIVHRVNGIPVFQQTTFGPPVQYPFYNNGLMTFLQADTTVFDCSFPKDMFSDSKYLLTHKFYMFSPFPLDPNNSSPILEYAKQFVMGFGLPYIDNTLLVRPTNIPPNEPIRMFVMWTLQYVNKDMQPANNRPSSPWIIMLGFIDSQLYPTNPEYFHYMVVAFLGAVRIWDYVDPGNQKIEFKGVGIGAYDSNGVASCPGLIVNSLVSVNPTSTQVPDMYSLSQNYPNPFNPSTKIKFSIPAVGQRHAFDVRLVIYDILGREIETLVNEELKPGTYEVDWNATGGVSNFPSGVYFYKLTAGDYFETKKMILLK
jgi:hypothetical protein